jgi:hypothetical protein
VDSRVSRVCSLLEAWCFRSSLDVAAVDSPVPTARSLPEASFFKRDVVALDSRISRVCCSLEASSSRGDVCRGFSSEVVALDSLVFLGFVPCRKHRFSSEVVVALDSLVFLGIVPCRKHRFLRMMLIA